MNFRPDNSSMSCEINVPVCNQHCFNWKETERDHSTPPFVVQNMANMQLVLQSTPFRSRGITIWLGVTLKKSESHWPSQSESWIKRKLCPHHKFLRIWRDSSFPNICYFCEDDKQYERRPGKLHRDEDTILQPRLPRYRALAMMKHKIKVLNLPMKQRGDKRRLNPHHRSRKRSTVFLIHRYSGKKENSCTWQNWNQLCRHACY